MDHAIHCQLASFRFPKVLGSGPAAPNTWPESTGEGISPQLTRCSECPRTSHHQGALSSNGVALHPSFGLPCPVQDTIILSPWFPLLLRIPAPAPILKRGPCSCPHSALQARSLDLPAVARVCGKAQRHAPRKPNY